MEMLYLLHGENIFSGSSVLQQRAELYLWSHLNAHREENIKSHSQWRVTSTWRSRELAALTSLLSSSVVQVLVSLSADMVKLIVPARQHTADYDRLHKPVQYFLNIIDLEKALLK